MSAPLRSKLLLATVILFMQLVLSQFSISSAFKYEYDFTSSPIVSTEPTVNDSSLKVELVFQGLKFPTAMGFLGPNDILVLEKDNGTVQRIINGKILNEPLLRVPVANKDERGLLGLAIVKGKAIGQADIFLYLTESRALGEDECSPPTWACKPGHDPVGNRLYKYELKGGRLTNPDLLLHLPAKPGPMHNGGKIVLGPDNNIYLTVGEVNSPDTLASNKIEGLPPNGSGGILRITQAGQQVYDSPLGDKFPLYLYYAYGIRNSFVLDFDPVTGYLWDTENGPGHGDEINLVQPGFNSGWAEVQGIRLREGYTGGNVISNNNISNLSLVNFNGNGGYHNPQFVWDRPTVAPTAIKFLNSSKLGPQYQNDMFVATIVPNGDIYHFELNSTRTGLTLNSTVANEKVDNNITQAEQVIFGHDFGGISDLQVGPDGYLYVLSYSLGKIYRIVPESNISNTICLHCS